MLCWLHWLQGEVEEDETAKAHLEDGDDMQGAGAAAEVADE